jgi:STE24 endopeptidase
MFVAHQEKSDMNVGLNARPLFLVLVPCLVSEPAFASGLLPEASAQAIHYQNSQDWFWCADQAIGFVIPLVVLFSGLGNRIAQGCIHLSGNRRLLGIALFAIAYATIDFSLNLPLAFWEGYANEHHYGLGTDSPGQWVKGQLIGLIIRLITVSLLTWVPYSFMQAAPRRWWLWTALTFVPLFIFTHLASPLWIAPLTNTFEPLSDKRLEARISSLATKAGIVGAAILVKDQSQTSTLPNAQVRGIFATKRIIIFDTMIGQTNERELLVVVAHEMGHYVAGDVWKIIALQSGLILLALWLTHLLGPPAIRRFESRWGFGSLSNIASLPLLYLAFNLVVLATTPAINAFIRNIEHNADRFALDLTHDSEAAKTVIVKYAKVALYVPDPGWFRKNFRMDHPSLDDRARFLNTYHPWIQDPAGTDGHGTSGL